MSSMIENSLPRTTPEQQGMASAAILVFVEALEHQVHETHSFMLLRHGSVVAEGWWSPYERDDPHMLFSLSKSFTSTAVGLAITEGYFTLDDPVLSFFPDDAPADVSAFLAAMGVRHLLSMSTGQVDDTFPKMIEHPDGNWTKAFFDVPVLREPGTHFLYNTGATYMLAAIVQKTTGQNLLDYLQPRLFEPLGIVSATWQQSPQGIHVGGTGLNITTEDIARFGQLYLQKGMWQGAQILPQAWVEEATMSHIANGTDPESDWAQGYGYQFWRCRHDNYRGDGAFGQFCIIMPGHDAVLAITSGTDDMQQVLDLAWEKLLPAMQADALPDDTAAQAALTTKLSGLARLPVPGAAESPTASAVSGQTYAFDANELKLETLTLNVDGPDGAIHIKTAFAEESIPFGYGQWQRGQTSLFNGPWEFEAAPVATSGAWTAEDVLTLIMRLYETPFYHTLTCHFVGNDLLIETRVNVSFGSLKPVLLTAHQI